MFDENLLVSIIIPSYNHERYIEQSICSVFSQTYSKIELIIIDDGSTDDSSHTINKLLSAHRKTHSVKFIQQENTGFVKTLNTALKLAQGDYIGFLASDDAYLPDKIRRSVDVLQNSDPDVAAVYTDGYLINDKGQKTKRYTDKYLRPLLHDVYKELLIANWIPALGMLYKRQIFDDVGMFDESIGIEDYEMLLRISRRYKILYLPEKHFLYRWHDTNMSKDAARMTQAFSQIADKHDDLRNFNAFKNALKNRDLKSVMQFFSLLNSELLVRSFLRKLQLHFCIQEVTLFEMMKLIMHKFSRLMMAKLRAVLIKAGGVYIGRGGKLYGKLDIVGNKKNIDIGRNVVVLGNARLITGFSYRPGQITIGDNTVLENNATIYSLGGNIQIGTDCFVGPNVMIQANGDISIGNFTMIASNAAVYANNHVTEKGDIPYSRQGNRFEGISIGRNCWLGTSVTVIDGANIGNDCIVGANCVVKGAHQAGSVIVARGVVGADIRRTECESSEAGVTDA